LLAAPLLAGNDLRNMSPAIHDILTNPEVIAVDQDKDGKQGRRVWKSRDQEIWSRELTGGTRVIGLFNRGDEESEMSFSWTDLKFRQAPKTLKVRDLWSHRDLGVQSAKYTVMVPAHGVILLGVKGH
jgi:alpha-galactosidase